VVLEVHEAVRGGGGDLRRPAYVFTLRGKGGDVRLLQGTVPPWPEEVAAEELGQELATALGVPFVFDRSGGPTPG
jgi:hypothetical protein